MDERLEFLGLDPDARRRLKALQPLVAAEIKPALDAFYAQVRATPQTRAFFTDDSHIDGASRAQEKHWALIAEAQFDTAYVDGVRRIGQAHARLGLEPRWYIGGYARILDGLVRGVIEARWPKGFLAPKGGAEAVGEDVGVLIRAAMLDMDFAISIYLEALDEARQRLEAERRASEARQAHLVEVLGAALARLSARDLGVRVVAPVGEEFQALKDDFNNAVAALEAAMTAVSDSTESVAGGVVQIGAAADDLSRRTEQQAASLEETAAALEQITATVQKSAEGARQASEAVATAKAQAERSAAVMTETQGAMGEIEHSASQISQIIGVIDEIAFQTNLLALNAGVEAARAGDAGKGFAVVASEVRALAQRSADAAKEIKTLISASTQQVEQGVALVAQTGEALTGILEQVAEIDGLVSEIAASSEEQSVGLAQVNTAVNQMDHLTQQNAAMVQQTTAATHTLKSQADDLGQLVGAFTVAAPSQSRAA
ncbi:globin-coupled sensor protein [Phenylobacterium sp. J367]|uniref:globin-coupled sensor protein n=1 Tax=Phenylobacterium sp. J367 TaxID=2898435 RepID=UPI002151C15F|nr:globin-coupled sensor protein [Phenylobacterium sp. J367]MCR5877142.1 globin-coupled sensor protein [Phenylobacterium sp. J367]